MREFRMKSYDNFDLYVTLWDDVKNPRGVVQLVHGMSEYAGFYDGFAQYLNSRGYIVFADDHRAHGRTESDKMRGNHKGNIFKKTLQDELFIRNYLKDKYALPVFYVGNSYGSFLGQAFAQSGTDCKAIALTGTGYMGPLFRFASILLAPIWLFARNLKPKITNFVSDRFIKFKGDKGLLQWLNTNKEKREEFLNGKYTHSDMSINFDFHMMNETAKLYSRKASLKLNPACAIGIFCGGDDIVGNKGKGAKKLHKFYENCGVNAELHLYEGCRHDVLNDKLGKQTQKDIADFFDKFIIYEQPSLF